MSINTPFYNAMAAIAHRGPRFFVPGHKGNPAAIAPFAPVLEWDMTEVEGACDLSCPEGPLAQSEANMARVFGAGASLYSAGGSTSVIQAMLALFCRPGMFGGPAAGAFADAAPTAGSPAGETPAQEPELVIARGCHAAAVRAMALLGLAPRWVLPRAGGVHPKDVAAALDASARQAAPGAAARAVYLTSPDYYGALADVAAIAKVCHSRGAALLVDNAHGAHLRFAAPPGAFSGGAGATAPADMHPLTLGADATADSAHKTLPCLTPAALFHLRDEQLASAGRKALNLFSSTSPAYPVLISLDLAAGKLLGDDAFNPKAAYGAAAGRVAALRAAAGPLCRPCADPLRLVLDTRAAQLCHSDVHAAFMRRGLAPEYDDGTALVFMASPFNSSGDFDLLEETIRAVLSLDSGSIRTISSCEPGDVFEYGSFCGDNAGRGVLLDALPEAVCSPRQALLSPSATVPVQRAAGRVMAGIASPCPPGVPLVAPGERIGEEAARRLAAGGVNTVDVL